MTTPDDIWWPDVLDSMESEHLVDASEDQQAAKELAATSQGEVAALRREVPAGIPGRPICELRSRVAADCGSHGAAAGESAGADDPAVAIASPDMTALHSDDIGFVSRQVRIAEDRLVPIEVDIHKAQEASDDDAHDATCEAFNVAYSDLVALEGRLMDLEDRQARAEWLSNKSWYQWSTR